MEYAKEIFIGYMIKFVESTISKGSMIYIPPYWWYSIKYSTTEEDAAIDITYNTIMNKVSYLPDNIKYFMQQQNTMKRIRTRSAKTPPRYGRRR
jgi:hypothetical protein